MLYRAEEVQSTNLGPLGTSTTEEGRVFHSISWMKAEMCSLSIYPIMV